MEGGVVRNFFKSVLFGAGYAVLASFTVQVLGFESGVPIKCYPNDEVVALGVLLVIEAPLTVFLVFKSVDGLYMAARIIFNRVK